MHHAARREDAIRRLFQDVRRAAHGDDLEAVIVIEVHVQRGDHRVAELVLDFRQALGELAHVVLVDEHQRAGDVAAAHHGLFDEARADQIADRLAAVRVPLARDLRVERGEQIFFDGHAEPDEVASHGATLRGFAKGVTPASSAARR